ncbi:hypothetical protein RUM43_007779 [Polyplax serrata]|uniref:Uncharacterized protein n=1 Tax=Polyplax serrata TaxID=468196 RepID=A0AAN8PDI6_POLSC
MLNMESVRIIPVSQKESKREKGEEAAGGRDEKGTETSRERERLQWEAKRKGTIPVRNRRSEMERKSKTIENAFKRAYRKEGGSELFALRMAIAWKFA